MNKDRNCPCNGCTSNASKPDPEKYISRLRKMTSAERRTELDMVAGKLRASQILGVLNLIEYYSRVHCWLMLNVSFEIKEGREERLDFFTEFPPLDNLGV